MCDFILMDDQQKTSLGEVLKVEAGKAFTVLAVGGGFVAGQYMENSFSGSVLGTTIAMCSLMAGDYRTKGVLRYAIPLIVALSVNAERTASLERGESRTGMNIEIINAPKARLA